MKQFVVSALLLTAPAAISSNVYSRRTTSTNIVDISDEDLEYMYRRIRKEFINSDCNFEDGKVSRLAHEILNYYYMNPDTASRSLNKIISSLENKDLEKAGEVVKWVGYAAAESEDQVFLHLLLRLLSNNSTFIRDASALALIDYGGLVPLGMIERAIENENLDHIKETLQYIARKEGNGEIFT